MTAYRLVFQIKSPLHIGWRKIGNLMQTRYYVPGRAFWGAVTANLTRWLGETNYRKIGEWVKKHLRFGYFFLAENPDTPLYPHLLEGRLIYGPNGLEQAKFERRFLSSIASTAITPDSNSAEEGSLHEVEFIKSSLGIGSPVYLVGHLFVHRDEKIDIRNDDVNIQGVSLFSQVIPDLQIGGERRYGFGRLALQRGACCEVNDVFGYTLSQRNGSYEITVPRESPVFADTIANNLNMSGFIEPLVSREWSQQGGPGRQLTLLGLTHVPGSVLCSEMTFLIGCNGVWKRKA